MNVPLAPVVQKLAAEVAELKVQLAMADTLIEQLMAQSAEGDAAGPDIED